MATTGIRIIKTAEIESAIASEFFSLSSLWSISLSSLNVFLSLVGNLKTFSILVQKLSSAAGYLSKK